MFIDTHCHLDQEFYDNIDDVILENDKALVDKIIVSGCNKNEIIEALKYADKYEGVYLTLGFHPDVCNQVTDDDLLWLLNVITTTKKVVGIGEIGLDYHYGKENRELQISLFEKQLQIAQKLNLPLVIHSRDATEDTISILKKYNLHGVIHCFSGSVETANIYIKMGYCLGIGGVVTFKNSKLNEVISRISINNIVLETDSPYLAPVPYRGSVNSSKYIPLIAQKIAEIYHISVEDVARITSNTAREIYKI